MQTRRQLLTSAAAIAVVSPAFAQGWPQRPVKVVVAFAPGGNSDSIARVACQRLSEVFGQTFVIENRPGGGGTIGAEAVARAAPDGYTLFVAATPQMSITPWLQKVPYDPVKDFAAISNIGSNPFVLSVNAKLPIKSVADFIAHVKARPGQVTFGSGGVGTLNHLSMTLFAKLAGIDITHVPYKGGGPAMADLVAGHINAMFANLSDALGQAGAGTIRLLAVSSDRRARQIPDVPTVIETGFPTFKTTTWNGLVAPAGTPREIVTRIAAEVARASKEPKYVERLAHIGVDAIGDTPEEFAATIASDFVFWGDAVKAAGLGR
ncbi:MAG: tripartite tricarboxylate transporter substrate binding protein [Xanthobacteraceae bacterium]|nr:tripartite tricarboxylate transporter substrate binding protein [Xanthobacteraceae bacterium]